MTTSDAANERPHRSQRLTPPGSGRTTGVRVASALLATGAYALLTGGVFLRPFVLSPYAIQNDVYMGNLFLAPPVLLVGLCCVVGGLLVLGRSRGLRGHRGGLLLRAVLLAGLGGAAVAVATFVLGGRYFSEGPSAPNWPPYLTLPLLGAALGIGVIVCVVAWIWTPAAPADGIGAT